MAVQFLSHNSRAVFFPSFPRLTRYLLSQPKPACAWLTLCDGTDGSTTPIECLDVTTSWAGVTAAINMTHPLDLRERM